MKLTVVSNLDDALTMMRKRGLEPEGRVQRMFTVRCAAEMDRYIPFQEGALKNTRIIETDSVTYNTPYARYHYFGKLMLAKSGSSFAKKGERKYLTKTDMEYHGAPKRGPFWDKRMWADKRDKIVNDVARAAGGKPK